MSESLESFLLLAKQATGKALVSLIRQVLVAPTIFTFTELLCMENTQNLATSDDAYWVTILELFSFGTYEEYKNRKTGLPVLENAELDKLKKLTLVSIASESHTLSYAMLMDRLDIRTTRVLEDLIIDAIYCSLIKAKLNTRTQSVYIESTAGRDLDPDASLDDMIRSLDMWEQTCETVLSQVKHAIDETKQSAESRRREKENHDRAIEDITRRLKSQEQARGGASTARSKRSAGFHAQSYDVVMDDHSESYGEGQGTTVGDNLSGLNRKRKSSSQARALGH